MLGAVLVTARWKMRSITNRALLYSPNDCITLIICYWLSPKSGRVKLLLGEVHIAALSMPVLNVRRQRRLAMMTGMSEINSG